MNKPVSIVLLGDIHFGPTAAPLIDDELKGLLSQADLVIGNMEGPIAGQTVGDQNKFILPPSPQACKFLTEWGVDVVSLANNHVFDYGVDGFVGTCRALDEAGIGRLGAGLNLDEACRPLIVEPRGGRIGLLAYSWQKVQTPIATDGLPGCAPLEKDLMLRHVRELRERCDAVIVLPHWGYCDYLYPLPQHVELGRQLIDAGAACVVGHHPHVCQGLIRHGDGLIAFSLADFWFTATRGRTQEQRSANNRKGLVLQVRLTGGRVDSFEVTPIWLTSAGSQADRRPGRRRELDRLSAPLDRQRYPRAWQSYVRWRATSRLLYWLNPFRWREINANTLQGGLLMLRSMFRTPGRR